MPEPKKPSILRQPTAVWAIAFACAVSFMGIGLVDPILPAISEGLNASPSQTMLLFTSYLLITAVAMFFSGFISSRVGVKRTLIAGLALIVIFAGLAGASDTVGQIIGFRAGWGLGNALFISTALAAIVGAASGGSRQAVILYEAALGIGMAVGPLLGGALGEASWRGPFFGTAALMAIALAAILVLLKAPSAKPEPVPFTAGLSALRNPALRTLAATALFYNYAFFTLLAYTPYPLEAAAAKAGMDFGAHELGLVFFGWGAALAVTSVFVAPILTRRLGLLPVLYSMFGLLAVGLAVMAIGVESVPILITVVIIAGLFLGVLNTALTETVMEATDLPRGVASSTYSGVRFLGGAIAPAVSGAIAETWGDGAPYWFGVAALAISITVLAFGRQTLSHLTRPHNTAEAEAELITVGDET
ncbi:MFS transporter [Glycomyces dulcitolivorans]|uniref:MFS transporter n=1 Tax=Glycomyces dulcitolivorans TaxID=2200759 RepID=UPI000DD2E68A|nr:MFS transporter [Glycomyces dulcitolivorans]